MNSENLRLAISKSKDITLNFLGKVLSGTRLEPIRDDESVKGIKASWVGEQGKSSIAFESGELNATVRMDAEAPPTVEYIQQGESRSIAVKNLNNITCEVDSDTLDHFASPRGAAIAICAGAAAGLVSWFAISVIRALAVSAKEDVSSDTTTVDQDDVLEADNDSAQV